MATGLTERRLVDILVAHFRTHHHTRREVPHYEKRIDVVAIFADTDELWAIEVKVSAWARAISQAVVNLAASERSYVAIDANNVHRVPLAALDAHGIGLISVGRKWGEVKIVHEARPSPFTNRLVVERLRHHVSKGLPCK
jgi:hypothetical protein